MVDSHETDFYEFFEAEGGGEERTEDKVFVAMPGVGMVQLNVPDDTEGEDDVTDDPAPEQ